MGCARWGDAIVVGLYLTFLLLWAVLVVFFWAATLWFQNYIYTEAAAHMHWRALAAGTILTLFYALWGFIDYRVPGRYLSLFDFSAQETIGPFKEIWAVQGKKETLYKLVPSASGPATYKAAGKPLPSRVDALIVEEEGQKVRFDVQRDQDGKIKDEPGKSLKYIDPRGRIMLDDEPGKLSIFHTSWLLGNLLLNLAHLLVWFACLWLVLQFQWSHALGLAVVFWIVMTIVILPMLLTQVEKAAAASGEPRATAEATYSPRCA
jgi:hypothetical protein